MPKYTEEKFEDHIEAHLNQSGYQSLLSSDYDKSLCLIPNEMLQFIKSTQPKEYQKLERQYGADTSTKLRDRVSREIDRRGVLDVLRKGISDRGCHFDLTYFLPSSGMNPIHQKLYSQNRFSLTRQLHYAQRNEKSLDMVLFLNGLPLVTMELKNSLTGQVFTDAEKQYRTEFTEEDKVDIETIQQKMNADEALRLVIEGDNSESSKEEWFYKVFDEFLLDYVNTKLELYKKLSKPEINAELKQHLYQVYLKQPSPSAQRHD